MKAGLNVYRRACGSGHAPAPASPLKHRETSSRDPFARLRRIRCFQDIAHDCTESTGIDIKDENLLERPLCAGKPEQATEMNTSTQWHSIPFTRFVAVHVRHDAFKGRGISAPAVSRRTFATDATTVNITFDESLQRFPPPKAQVPEPSVNDKVLDEPQRGKAGSSASIQESSAPGNGQTFSLPNLPPSEEDGLVLKDWSKHGPALEKKRILYNTKRHGAERIRRFNRRHPVHWNDLFEMMRRFTPNADHARLSMGAASLQEEELRSLAVDATDRRSTSLAVGSVVEISRDFHDLMAFMNRKVPGLQLGPKGLVPQMTTKIMYYFNVIAADEPGSIRIHVANEALRFLAFHAERPYATGLLFKFRSFGLKPDISTLNVFLTRAASEQHINAMERYTKMVIKAGLTLDSSSWAALLHVAPTEEDKRRAIREMGRKGLLVDPKAHRQVIPMMLQQSLGSHLDAGNAFEEYLQTISLLYGSMWLSPETVHNVLEALASRGRFDEALRFLLWLQESHSFKPGSEERFALLTHHALTQDLPRTVQTYIRFGKLFDTPPSKRTFRLIFTLAWKLKYYNVLKVTWRYACLERRPTYDMSDKIKKSLRSGLSVQRLETRRGQWMADAGFVACGRVPDDSFDTLRSQGSQESAEILDMKVLELMNDEINASKRVPGAPTFSEALLAALHRDLEWAKDKSHLEKSAEWKTQNAVSVAVRPGANTGIKSDKKRPRALTWSEKRKARTVALKKKKQRERQTDRAKATLARQKLDRKLGNEGLKVSRSATSRRRRPMAWRPMLTREELQIELQRPVGDWWEVGWEGMNQK